MTFEISNSHESKMPMQTLLNCISNILAPRCEVITVELFSL